MWGDGIKKCDVEESGVGEDEMWYVEWESGLGVRECIILEWSEKDGVWMRGGEGYGVD